MKNKSFNWTPLIITGSVLLMLVVGWFAMSISATNSESRIRNTITAKIKVNKSSYTKMFEILTEEAGVSKQYANDFKEIYPKLVAGRYNNGNGQMMQWIQEHNPTFDTKLYQKVMQSIEAQRESFHTNQEQLADLSREHDNLLTTWPSRIFLSDKKHIDIPIVINDEAEAAFATGKEKHMNLFPDKSKDSVK